MDKAAVTDKSPMDGESHLLIEDGSGARSFLPWNDTLTESEYLFALRGNEDFLGEPGTAGRAISAEPHRHAGPRGSSRPKRP